MKFQSTHPARGATCAPLPCLRAHYVSIHAPREGCDLNFQFVKSTHSNFNPRTPRGVRRLSVPTKQQRQDFNPRTPRGVRLIVTEHAWKEGSISIHAPREGCDLWRALYRTDGSDFNPRTPRGVRPTPCMKYLLPRYFNPRTPRGVRRPPSSKMVRTPVFQSTHPARGATRRC